MSILSKKYLHCCYNLFSQLSISASLAAAFCVQAINANESLMHSEITVSSKQFRDVDNLYVSWPEYYDLARQLAFQIKDSDWEFDYIIGIARGGLPIADYLSRVFQKPMAVMCTSSYKDDETKPGQMNISKHIAMTANTLGKRVLIADDLVDSGETLKQLMIRLADNFPEIEFRTAVLWCKEEANFEPTYHLYPYTGTNTWIHQPFEVYSPSEIEAGF